MATDIEDYRFSQAHRKASEAYIAAQQGDDEDIETIMRYLDEAKEYGIIAFSLARNMRQRTGEYNFLMAVAGLRTIVEMGYESVVVQRPDLTTKMKEYLNGLS